MTNRPNGNISVSTTDVLSAMLTSDLRGSWAERGARRRREPADPAGEPAAPAGERAAAGEPAGPAGEPAAPAGERAAPAEPTAPDEPVAAAAPYR